MSKLLLIESFYSGSHKQLVDLLHKKLGGSDLVTMSGKKWHWRARTSALWLSQQIPRQHQYRTLFASSVLNLSELVALRTDLLPLRKVLYFHENQLCYPVQVQKDRDFQYGYNQITSCLVADVIVFNSKYNMDSFLNRIPSFLKRMPDYRPGGIVEQISEKCKVLNFPIVYPSFHCPKCDKTFFESSFDSIEGPKVLGCHGDVFCMKNDKIKEKNVDVYLDKTKKEDIDSYVNIDKTKGDYIDSDVNIDKTKEENIDSDMNIDKTKGDHIDSDVKIDKTKEKNIDSDVNVDKTKKENIDSDVNVKSAIFDKNKIDRRHQVGTDKYKSDDTNHKHTEPVTSNTDVVDLRLENDNIAIGTIEGEKMCVKLDLGRESDNLDTEKGQGVCEGASFKERKEKANQSNCDEIEQMDIVCGSDISNSQMVDSRLFNHNANEAIDSNMTSTNTQEVLDTQGTLVNVKDIGNREESERKRPKMEDTGNEPPLHIVWPHRWEHDKNPESFFKALIQLQESGCDFRVSVLGENYTDNPAIFEVSYKLLDHKILAWGYQESKTDYFTVLHNADIVVSTAHHEFFGVAMLEAVHLGCYPLVPNRLVYPEIFTADHLYNTDNQLFKKLRNFCKNPAMLRRKKIEVNTNKYSWDTLKDAYVELLSQST